MVPSSRVCIKALTVNLRLAFLKYLKHFVSHNLPEIVHASELPEA